MLEGLVLLDDGSQAVAPVEPVYDPFDEPAEKQTKDEGGEYGHVGFPLRVGCVLEPRCGGSVTGEIVKVMVI